MENNSLKIKPDDSHINMRLDKFLAANEYIGSRTRASQLIEQGFVRLQGSGSLQLKASYKIKNNDCFIVSIPTTAESSILEPLDIPLNIVYDDDDLFVVEKPSGLVVHPAAGHANDTLVNALVHKVKNLSMGFGEERPGLVHRLDKDTSGLLVVAKNDRAQEHLAQQFKNKTVHRIYKAIVYGTPKQSQGTIESSLIRHPKDRKKFSSEKISTKSSAKGKWAITHYKLLQTFSCGLSLIECQLETGRTHQIRVHVSENQFPIVGDPIYSTKNRLKNLKSTQLRGIINRLDRIALHAEKLGFTHPASGERLSFSTSWPDDMDELFEFLKGK